MTQSLPAAVGSVHAVRGVQRCECAKQTAIGLPSPPKPWARLADTPAPLGLRGPARSMRWELIVAVGPVIALSAHTAQPPDSLWSTPRSVILGGFSLLHT